MKMKAAVVIVNISRRFADARPRARHVAAGILGVAAGAYMRA
jgi:hypothetical protein